VRILLVVGVDVYVAWPLSRSVARRRARHNWLRSAVMSIFLVSGDPSVP